MSLRRWWNRVAARLSTIVLRIYFATLRVQVLGKDRAVVKLSTSDSGCLFLMWHDSVLLTPLIAWATAWQPICLLISYSRDGDIATEIGKRFPSVDVIRVKHSSRAGALVECCRLLKNRHNLLITPDGPRGPRHQIKPGALFACQRCASPIIPVVYAASRQITLSSWDRFRIPLPFSRVLFSILEPISCFPHGDLDQLKSEVEQKMSAEEERLAGILIRG